MLNYELIATQVACLLLFPLVATAFAEVLGGTTAKAAESIDIKNPDLNAAIGNARKARGDALYWFVALSVGYAGAVGLAFPVLRSAFIALEAPVITTPVEKIGPVAIVGAAFLVSLVLLFMGAALSSDIAAYRRIADVLELTKRASGRYLDGGRSEGFVLFLRNFTQERRDYEGSLRTHPQIPAPLVFGREVRDAVLGLAPKWVVVEAANLAHPPEFHRAYLKSETLPPHLPISLYDRDNWQETVAQWISRSGSVILHLNSHTDALAAEAAMAAASRRPLLVFAERSVWRAWRDQPLPPDTLIMLYEGSSTSERKPGFAVTRAGEPMDDASSAPPTMTIAQMQGFLRDWVGKAASEGRV
jgi:hypothetical protein